MELTESDVCCFYNKYHHTFINKYTPNTQLHGYITATINIDSHNLVEINQSYTRCLNNLIKKNIVMTFNPRELLLIPGGKIALVIIMLNTSYLFLIYHSDLIKPYFILSPRTGIVTPPPNKIIKENYLKEYTCLIVFKSMVLEWINKNPPFDVVYVNIADLDDPVLEYHGFQIIELIAFLRRYLLSQEELITLFVQWNNIGTDQMVFVSTENLGRLYYTTLVVPKLKI